MACTSGSVQSAADKTVAAAAQIAKLQAMLQVQESANKATFYDDINSHLADADVTDAREISYNSAIKTEYSSEFSLDKIAAVVITALSAVAAAKDPAVASPVTSPAAIQSYTALVNSVAEAAKSSSTAAASLSFSMNRLAPGMFAFLYAISVNIQDSDTFGSEAVTTTAIYYRFMESIEDLQNEAAFGAAQIDASNLLHMKTLQAALTDDLGSGKIDIDLWTKKDAEYSGAIAIIQTRLDAESPTLAMTTEGVSVAPGSAADQGIVRAAIQKLSAMGDAYKGVVETSEARLASVYY